MSPPGPGVAGARRRAARTRVVAVSVSLACHVCVVLALIWARRESAPALEPLPITVALVEEPPLQPPTASPPGEARPAPPKPPPPRNHVRVTSAPPDKDSLQAEKDLTAVDESELSEGQVAGAANADAGTPGGPCDMARRLQAALRSDPLVRAAIAPSAGKATLVWNGDWVKSHGEDGKGLAAVREAILWEVGFAPKACQALTVRGLILFSVRGPAGTTRLALGAGEWRWSDLLAPRPGY